ncbi:glycosyltransferase involved in cell wall biosynthesis [Marinobacter oulmenensis]|uniref:Glycosyltransferase involved in cell wall biosynthesis n=1 Tax=Marinobacter oulmenensis TaxID=643747 RepID=A0A840U8T5_9GAMM|nr:glycosyltransferase involved in cell wall biosynthesis [Marinobacter oulmenensis]
MTTAPHNERRRQHISIVSETFPPEINGVANTLQHLCEGLVARGHQVSVIRPRQRGERGQAEAASSIPHQVVTGLPLPGYSELRFGLVRPGRLVRQWRNRRPDAVYVATQGPLGVAATLAAKRLNLPVFSGFHTNFHSYSGYYGLGMFERILRSYGRWFHNRTDLTLVPTLQMQTATRAMGITNTRLWSRGVDCRRFCPQRRDTSLREHWGLGPDDRAVLYVGRLAAEKNIQLAVACFERIRGLHPGARFVLVGDGPLRRQLQERHPEYHFCGVQKGEALARHYASGDIFLFPSKTDTFGNVVMEAMASGLGTVAFDDAAAGEHLRHDENGVKAAVDDDEAFITHAIRLADQPSLLNRVRSQARLDALDQTWDSQIEVFEQLVFNTPAKARHHGINKQSVSLF